MTTRDRTDDGYDPRLTVSGSGPAVVLVPGMDGTGLLFYRQVPLLARGYRVATFALRESATGMDVLVEDLRAVVQRVSPDRRAIVIGESFGGALAMTFAIAHPHLVDALVVVNSFPYFAPQHRLSSALIGLRLMPWGMMGLVRRLTAFRMHSPHTSRAEIHEFMRRTRHASREGYLNRLRILRGWDIRDRLDSIAADTLFVAAADDHLVPAVAQARLMAGRVPRASVRVLPGHGHICLIAPDVDLAAILADWRGAPSHPAPSGPPR